MNGTHHSRRFLRLTSLNNRLALAFDGTNHWLLPSIARQHFLFFVSIAYTLWSLSLQPLTPTDHCKITIHIEHFCPRHALVLETSSHWPLRIVASSSYGGFVLDTNRPDYWDYVPLNYTYQFWITVCSFCFSLNHVQFDEVKDFCTLPVNPHLEFPALFSNQFTCLTCKAGVFYHRALI